MPFDLSLQLYTVRSHTQRDLEGTLRQLAAFGYEFVEFAGLCGHTPEAVAEMLHKNGIRASGAHVSYEEAKGALETLCAQYGALGVPELTVPYLPEEVRRGRGDWHRVAEALENCAAQAGGRGFAFSYHNHAFEFDPVDETCGFDILTANTSALQFQVDVFWVVKGGRDPVECLRSLQGRVRSVHLKDLRQDGEDVEWGLGTLDHLEVLACCRQTGVGTLVLELDTPKMEPLESARVCLENLREMLPRLMTG